MHLGWQSLRAARWGWRGCPQHSWDHWSREKVLEGSRRGWLGGYFGGGKHPYPGEWDLQTDPGAAQVEVRWKEQRRYWVCPRAEVPVEMPLSGLLCLVHIASTRQCYWLWSALWWSITVQSLSALWQGSRQVLSWGVRPCLGPVPEPACRCAPGAVLKHWCTGGWIILLCDLAGRQEQQGQVGTPQVLRPA